MGILGRLIKPFTKRMRAREALKYVKGDSILDIGCGDGFFLSKVKCEKKVGIDKIHGQVIDKKLDFPSKSFDTVSMLAVIEHLEHDKEIINECYRVLKDGGRLIITTPLVKAEKFIKHYDPDTGHVKNYDYDSLKKLLCKFKIMEYHKFDLGMNQIVVCSKI